MTRRLASLLLFAALGGCQCRPSGPVDPIALGLRVSPKSIDFGRVLEGTVETATLTLTAETRAAVSVGLSADAPFEAPSAVEVPGGGDVTITISFRAGSEPASGALTLQVGDSRALVPLSGVGVRPPECRPSAECIVSTYSLEEDRCIETQAADDAPCDPASVCLEQGRCRAGQCLGIARRCDDDDRCTDDACAMDVGCIHTPHACPAPTAACQVATCDARAGCGFGPANDLTICGTIDCVSANFCFQGQCRNQPTAEGTPCAAPFACLPEGQCHNQECTRVNEGDWVPDWSTRLPGTPTGGLESSGSNLYFSLCVELADAGPLDGGLDDAGVDAGVDAGAPMVCGLVSYTGSGFERFTHAYDDGLAREVLAINGEGVVLRRDGGLEVRATNNGSLRFDYPFLGARTQVVVARNEVFVISDGGLQSFSDAGVQWWAVADDGAELARGDALFAWNGDAGVLTRFEVLSDGGLDERSFSVPVGPASLAVSGDVATFGASARFTVDAGFLAFDFGDAGVTRFFHEQTLFSPQTTNTFFERCNGPVCDQVVRVFDGADGSPLWETRVVDGRTPGTRVLDRLVLGPPGAMVSLVRFDGVDGGAPRAAFELFAEGESKALCRLPEASGALELAHLSSSALVVTSRRPDGGVVLESYGVGAAFPTAYGWSSRQGVGSTRTDRR